MGLAQRSAAKASKTAGATAKSTLEFSGAQWVNRFPGSKSLRDLKGSFRNKVEAFIDALRITGATVSFPHSGANKQLHRVGASYGVIQYNRTGRDEPHWSDNGACYEKVFNLPGFAATDPACSCG